MSGAPQPAAEPVRQAPPSSRSPQKSRSRSSKAFFQDPNFWRESSKTMVTQTESGPWRQRVRAENETFSRSFDTRDKYKQVAPGSQAAVSAAYNGFVHHGTGTPEPPPVTATHLDLTRLYVSRVNNFAYKDLRLPHNSAHAPAPLASPSAAAAVAANAAPALHQTAAPLPLAAAPASAAPSAAAAPTPIAPVTAAAASQSPSPVPAPSQATARGAARRVAF